MERRGGISGAGERERPKYEREIITETVRRGQRETGKVELCGFAAC